MIEMILMILFNVVWPPKGIIYMEEQLLQWGIALLKGYSTEIMVIVITIFGIGMLLYSANLSRYFRRVRGSIRHLGFGLLYAIRNILFAWYYLVWGAIHGRVDRSEHGSRTSLHYRFGRWLYRMLYIYVFRFIHNNRVREIVSRVIALVIIFWGVWNIPGDLGFKIV